MRKIHMVGSLPAESTEKAMRWMLDTAKEHLVSLPDGETGERKNYIKPIVEKLDSLPELEIRSDGDWSTFNKRRLYRIKKGHRLQEDKLDDILHYFMNAKKSWSIFQKLRKEYNLPNLSFQVGIPSDFVMAFVSFGLRGFLYRKPFANSTIREIYRIVEMIGKDVIFQLELTGETLLTAKMPKLFQSMIARIMLKGIIHLAAASPKGTRFGIHLCVGSLNNQSVVQLDSAAPIVALTNAIVKNWPSDCRLEFIHIPFADGQTPPSLDKTFYLPLQKMQLPSNTRLIAGLVHPAQSFQDQCQALKLVEHCLNSQVDVASPCGLGRYLPDDARSAMERAVDLIKV